MFPKALVDGRSAHEIIISEAHSLLAHLGTSKTASYLRDHVWWKSMVADTRAFCETCTTCKRSKPNNQKPYGLLNPLAVPSEPWESIGIDFVGPLPLSHNQDGEFDSITVVICLLTAMVEIIPSHTTYKAPDVAELMFENVYKHHGLPKNIVSDRDSLFTSSFWERLHTLMGVRLRMSSAYHPQSDGATERANWTITQMLRQCINPNQKDWVSKLLAIQFAINSAQSESTGYSPFFLNTGRMPRVMIWNAAKPTEFSNVRLFAQKRKLALMSAHDSIIAARVKQTRDANMRRKLEPFKKDDFVYLSTQHVTFAKGLARKLLPKFIGPYKIIQDFKNQSFMLDLPVHLKKRGVHDVFHSSLLRIHHPNDDRLFPGRMDSQIGVGPDSDDEWAVDTIRSHAGSGKDAIFEVLWKSGDITWMPYYQIKHVPALDAYLDLLGINDAMNLPARKGKPPQDDPQIFLGLLALTLACDTVDHHDNPQTTPYHPTQDLNPSDRHPSTDSIPKSTSTSATIVLPISLDNMHDSIRHRNFDRLTKQKYAFNDNNKPSRPIVHVGQISEYLNFDQFLRDGNDLYSNTDKPLGYESFAAAFNTGAHPKDRRRLSTFIPSDSGPYMVFKSDHAVTLQDFKIRSEDFNIKPMNLYGMTEEQAAIIIGRYATSQVQQDIQKTQHSEVRQEKRETTFKRHSVNHHKASDQRKSHFKKQQRGKGKQRRYYETTPGPPVGSTNIRDTDSYMYSLPPSIPSMSNNQSSVMSSSASVITVPPDFTSINLAATSGFIPLNDTTNGFPSDVVTQPLPIASTSEINIDDQEFTGVGDSTTYEAQPEDTQNFVDEEIADQEFTDDNNTFSEQPEEGEFQDGEIVQEATDAEMEG